MPTPSRIEYRVLKSKVFAEEHIGYLALEVDTEDGTIVLHMPQSVFHELSANVAAARDALEKRTRGA